MNITEDFDKLKELLACLDKAERIKNSVDKDVTCLVNISIDYNTVNVPQPIAVALGDCLLNLIRNAAVKQGEELTEKVKNYAPLKPKPLVLSGNTVTIPVHPPTFQDLEEAVAND